ncbi:MAG TPA: hypothetical protein VFZ61_28035 [Polyangiales bacterium]
MDEREKEIYTRVIDVLLRVEATVQALQPAVITLNSSVTQLLDLGIRLERKLDAYPAE